MLEGEALNRAVAEALGWTNIKKSSYWVDDYDGSAEIHCLFGNTPDNSDYRPLLDWATNSNLTIEVIKNVIPFKIVNAASQSGLFILELQDETHHDIKWDQIAPILLNRWLDAQKRWKESTPADET